MQIVDWNTPHKLPAPRAAQPDKRETHFRVTCDGCGYQRWLTRNNARRAEVKNSCRICHCTRAGRLGAAATLALYGREFLLKICQERQLERPSEPERIVGEWLVKQNIPHKTQVIFPGQTQNFILDFVINIGGEVLALEVNGYWHNAAPQRQQRDTSLQREYPGELIMIPASRVYTATFFDELKEVLYGTPV